MKILASAKLNLYLDVIGRRDDGYHEIETFYQPVSLWDELTIEKAPSGVSVEGEDAAVPWNEDNLCHRAARLIIERTGLAGGVRIRVEKGIPPGAGLGGGSSDAAAVLLGVNRLYGCGLPEKDLSELAAAIGSDVPFFLLGRSAIGRGRGEVLEEAPGLAAGWILIVKPEVTISTRWAYQNLNLVLTKGSGTDRLTALVEGLQRFPEAPLEAHNSFEAMVREHFPSVSGILEALKAEKPVLSSLSGSGSACFAVFAEEREARDARGRLEGEGMFTRIVQPVTTAIRFV
ncbi:MAG: 4-(cytidine 5'-diphospho)-2-C-methyl-D-erythritol kinase [Candidatus Krumholzibacteriaceae bacterium]|jgi:4-diphosphocytidyl-2-C-methyl-D-erythritol kinase